MSTFISDFTGLCNRLEALTFAYVIRHHFRHPIVLDWPELDSFQVAGTKRGPMRWYHRPGSVKLRDCDDARFAALGRCRHIRLRGFPGGPPAEWPDAARQVAGDLRLEPRLAQAIRAMFEAAPQRGRPVVGVHLRRGDFVDPHAKVYDLATQRHAAVPDWWFAWAMAELKSRYPDVTFFLSGTGDPALTPRLGEFDFIRLQTASPYGYKGESHASAADPVGDLFALACCPVILATPGSSFSHWAANILGAPSRVLMPPARTSVTAPQMITPARHVETLNEWKALSYAGEGALPIRSDADLPAPAPPSLDWF